MSEASEIFKVRINDGPPRDFVAATGMYIYAALQAVLSRDYLLPLPGPDEPIHVEIWCPRLLPEHGPYHYLVWEDASYAGRIHVATAVAKRPAAAEQI